MTQHCFVNCIFAHVCVSPPRTPRHLLAMCASARIHGEGVASFTAPTAAHCGSQPGDWCVVHTHGPCVVWCLVRVQVSFGFPRVKGRGCPVPNPVSVFADLSSLRLRVGGWGAAASELAGCCYGGGGGRGGDVSGRECVAGVVAAGGLLTAAAMNQAAAAAMWWTVNACTWV